MYKSSSTIDTRAIASSWNGTGRRNDCFDPGMTRQSFARSCLIIATLAAGGLSAGACARQDARIQQHQEKLESLGATTAAIGRAWLGGDTSGTFTRTALEQTFKLVEQERSALAGSPQTLLDPRAAHLSQAAEACRGFSQ